MIWKKKKVSIRKPCFRILKLFGIKIPMMASLILWAIAWEIVGQLELSILLPPFSSIVIRLMMAVSWAPTAPLAASVAPFGRWSCPMRDAVLVKSTSFRLKSGSLPQSMATLI